MFLFAYDDSKKVSCREVGAVIRSVGLNPTEAELKEMQDVVTKQCKYTLTQETHCFFQVIGYHMDCQLLS